LDNNNNPSANEFDWKGSLATSATFYYDIVAPTAAFTSPASGGNMAKDPTLWGTYYDANSGVNNIKVLIADLSRNVYWDKTNAWTSGTNPATSNWPQASIWSSSWTYTMPANSLPDGSF